MFTKFLEIKEKLKLKLKEFTVVELTKIGLVIILIVCCIFLLVKMLSWQDQAVINRYLLEEQMWAERKLMSNITKSEKDKYLDTTAHYYKIMGWHGYKPKYSKRCFDYKNSKGMDRFKKVLICQKSYEYEKRIGLPKYTFKPLGFIESNFNPIEVGGLDEGGYLQIHREAVGQAFIFHSEMEKADPKLAKELKFYYSKRSDLFDPLNCLRIAACNLWGLNRLYGGNMLWVISTYHWGLTRIWSLWKSPNVPKKIWKFYTIERKKGVPQWKISSIRNPMMYYFIWYEIQSAWSSGRKDINVETINYMKRYMKNTTKEKRQWIHSWRYNQQLLGVIADFKKRSADYDKAYKRMNTVALKSKKEFYKYYKTKSWKKSKNIMGRLYQELKRIVK